MQFWIRNSLFGLIMAFTLAVVSVNAHAANTRNVLGNADQVPLNTSADPEIVNKLQVLRQQASNRGATRIIVGVRAAFAPEGKLNAAGVKLQRSEISKKHAAILGKHPSLNNRPGKNRQFATIPFMALEVDASELEALAAEVDITSIEEDQLMYPSLAQSVPLIGGTAAWNNGYTGTGQTVAILDTGVDKLHPFLADKVVSEACYSSIDSINSGSPLCPGGVTSSTAVGSAMPYGGNCPAGNCDHGTHVAGITAGNSASFSGVAKDASLIAIQVFTRFDGATNCGGPASCVGAFTSDIILGLERVYALRNTYSIASVNMSLGGGAYLDQASCDANNLSTKTVIDNLRSANIATVIASGNNGYTNQISAPGCISSAVSVGATTKTDLIASYSNSANFLSLLAPGSSINSSIPGGGYAVYNGTSMATPHVAGAWALLKQQNVNITVTDALNALSTTGVNITDARNGIVKPRIQIDAALNSLSTTPPTLGFSSEAGYGTDGVNIDLGSASTSFTYKVVYFDTNNIPPTSIRVCIDGSTCPPMSKDTGASDPALRDNNYRNGEQYVYTTSLAAGVHNYYFNAAHGIASANLPATGNLSGPTVSDLTISTATLPNGAVGTPYSAALLATGGSAPYSWGASGLPVGLGMDYATGTISGTPTAQGAFGFMVSVTDTTSVQFSKAFSINIPDDVLPTVPTGLIATAAGATRINLSWAASSDNVGVTLYKVYRGPVQVGTSTGTSYSDTGLLASTTYSYTVAACDAAANCSAQSTAASETTGSVTTLFYEGFESGNFNTWTIGAGAYTRAVTSATSAAGVFSFTQTGGNSTHFNGISKNFSATTPTYIGFYARTDTMTAAGTANTYFVIGDANIASNFGIIFFSFSNGQLSVYDGTAARPGGAYAINTWYHIEFQNINWTAKTYDFYVNGVLKVPGVPFRSKTTTSLTNLQLYNFSNATAWYDDILMADATGTTDAIAPSVPSGLSAAAINESQINLSWTASTDNVGVTAYKVYRDGILLATLGNVTSYSNTGLAASTTYSYTVAACDAAANCSAQSLPASTATFADTIAPTVPTGLAAFAVGATQINLTWIPSVDNIAVTSYMVFRNGVQVGTSPIASFSDTGLTASTDYSYTIAACDGAGNCSAQSAAKTIAILYFETATIVAPITVTELIYAPTFNSLMLKNSASAIATVDIGSQISTSHSPTWNFTDMSLAPSGRYVFAADYGGENIGYGTPANQHYVHRLDLSTGIWETKTAYIAGNIEAVSDSEFILKSKDQWVTFTNNDWGMGSAVVKLSPSYYASVYFGDFRYVPGTGRLLHGNSGSSSQEIQAFNIVNNNFTKLEGSGGYGSAQGYGPNVTLATDGSAFYYGRLQVNPLDVRLNLRVFPETIYAATKDVAFGNGNFYDAHTGVLLGNLGFNTTVYGLNPNGRDFWAYDPSQNKLRHFSPPGNAIPDIAPPAVPAGLTASAASATQVSLSWMASTDDVGVTAYKVYRNGVQVGTPAGTSWFDTGLAPSSAYSYTVAACDEAGNCSVQSPAVSATTVPDTTAPSVPTGLTASAASATQINLTWTASGDNVGVTAYKVYRGGALLATLGNLTSYSDTGLTTATTYSYTVAACDAAGSCSAQSTTASAKTLDNIAPTLPTGLTATAVSSSQINLLWTAAIDNVGVTNYKIYRDGALLTTLGNVTNYSNTGLTALTIYSYTVAACDAAGNCSEQSSAASATTQAPDTTPPSVPTGLTANAISASQVNLTWTSAIDNVGVTGYRIYRNGTLLVTLGIVTSYSNSGLTAVTTYSYTVAACDAAGNCSAQSSAASATTPAEAFPPNGVMPVGWVTSPGANAGWAVASDAAYEGSFSLKSGMIGHSQTASVEVTGTYSAGTVSFARKVSSEANYDHLRFYIDGILQTSWSGEHAWAVVSYTVSAGTHTFRWSYTKDSSVVAGSDAAWVDSVTLPIASDTTPPVVTPSVPGGTYSSAKNVTLSVNESAIIYFTVDGSTPTNASTVYTSAIAVNSSLTLNYFAIDNAGNASAVQSQIYTINLPLPAPVVAWGDNSFGQTTVPAGLVGVVAIAGGISHTVALRIDGTVVAWGDNTYGQTNVPTGLSGVVAISAGAFHTIVLKNDGTLVAWGNNNDGQTTIPAGLSGVTAIAAGRSHNIALKSDGTVVAWGNNLFSQTMVPAGLSGVTAVSAGGFGTGALKNDGTVVVWGLNNAGQANVPAGLNGVVSIAISGNHSVALKSDSTVVAWGSNGQGQSSVPSGLSGVQSIAVGTNHTMAMKTDGTVVVWGDNTWGQRVVPADLSGVIAIAAGNNFSLALGGSPATDNAAPTVPGNLMANAVSSTQIDLVWMASSDNFGVTLYKVYRDGVEIGATTVNSFTDIGLTASTTYSYRVAACDAAGNCSLQSFATLATTPGKMVLSQTTLDFAPQNMWTSSPAQTVVVTNNSNTLINIMGINTTPDFILTHNCGAILAAGASCTLNVTFRPLVAGPINSILNIQSDAPAGSQNVVNLSGFGNFVPALSVSTATLDFAPQNMWTSSPQQSVVVTNNSITPINFMGINTTPDFILTHNCGAILEAGASCTLSVTFKPLVAGPINSILNIQSDAPAGSQNVVNLSGFGNFVPALSVSTATLDFAPQNVGTSSAPQLVVVSNNSVTPISITAINSTPDFILTHDCGALLAAGASCTINVRFVPLVAGPINSIINIQSDAPPGSQNVVNLSGTGLDAVAPVVIASIPGGTYAAAQSVTLSTNEPSTIYYTQDGSTPTSSSSIYTTAIAVNSSMTLQYFAIDTSGNASAVQSQIYVIDMVAPTVSASIASGTYSAAQSVTLSADESATIYYTLDGSTPTTASTIYVTPVAISVSTTLKYFGKDAVGNTSAVQTQSYVIDSVAPVITPSVLGGLYGSTQTVSLNTTEPATIYYTLNGSSPTASSTIYTTPIVVSATTTLKYFGKDTAGNASAEQTQTYVIDTVAPVITPSVLGGTYGVAQSITLIANELATIYYTLDGSTPTSASTVYTSPIAVSATTTLKYFGKDTVGNVSAVQTQSYVIDAVAPVITPSVLGGTYGAAQTVTLSSNEPATIYYTLNGTTPTTASAVYTTPILLSATTTLKYFGMDILGNTSVVNTQNYTISAVDLVMTALSTSTTSIRAGNSFSLRNTEKNIGTTKMTVSSNTVNFYLSTDSTITTSDTKIGSRSVNVALESGASSSSTKTVTVPSTLTPGTYYIGAIADATNIQSETNESNNAMVGATIVVR